MVSSHRTEKRGEIFVHFTGIEGEGYRNLEKGEKVSFVIEETEKGPQAAQVRAEGFDVTSWTAEPTDDPSEGGGETLMEGGGGRTNPLDLPMKLLMNPRQRLRNRSPTERPSTKLSKRPRPPIPLRMPLMNRWMMKQKRLIQMKKPQTKSSKTRGKVLTPKKKHPTNWRRKAASLRTWSPRFLHHHTV